MRAEAMSRTTLEGGRHEDCGDEERLSGHGDRTKVDGGGGATWHRCAATFGGKGRVGGAEGGRLEGKRRGGRGCEVRLLRQRLHLCVQAMK